jgi:GNAT superfamily N-acetyltransferase
MEIEITEPKTEQELEEYYRLRYERLRKPIGQPPGTERDEAAEAASTHMIVKADGRVIAAGCWAVGTRKDQDTGKRRLFVRFRQMAVDPQFEGRGIGTTMTAHVEARAREIGATEIVGNVRLENVPYFENLGWKVLGPGETLFGTLEHISMARPLS